MEFIFDAIGDIATDVVIEGGKKIFKNDNNKKSDDVKTKENDMCEKYNKLKKETESKYKGNNKKKSIKGQNYSEFESKYKDMKKVEYTGEDGLKNLNNKEGKEEEEFKIDVSNLEFNRRTLKESIVYSEIIGKPKARCKRRGRRWR